MTGASWFETPRKSAAHHHEGLNLSHLEGRPASLYRLKSGCQSRSACAALVTVPILVNNGVSSIMVRARCRLRASQIARRFKSSISSKSMLWPTDCSGCYT